MSGECAGRKGVRPPRPKTKGAVLCGSAPLNGCGFGGGAAKRRPRFLASLPWFRTTGLLACPRSPPSLPRGFPSSGPMGSSGLQWRVRAGFSPASRASSKRRVTPSRKDDSMMKSECQGVSRPPQKRGGVHRGRARRPMRCFYILLGIMNAVSNYHALEGWQWPRGSLT